MGETLWKAKGEKVKEGKEVKTIQGEMRKSEREVDFREVKK